MNTSIKDLNKEPLVSIIMPSYNSQTFIEKSIDAIIQQTYQNLELLITDDCSEDNTFEIIKKYELADERIKVFRSKSNSGAGVARNNSIENANGRFIAFCDSDDRWFSDKLEKQIQFMLENRLGLSYTNYEIVNDDEKKIGVFISPPKITYKDMLKQDEIGCLTVIYDAEILGKYYMPSLRKRQDWALWLNILKKTPYAMGLNETLATYKKREDSISSNKLKLVKYIWYVYRNEQKLNLITAFYHLTMYPFYYFKKIILNLDKSKSV